MKELIYKRRSVRRYLNKEVDEKTIQNIEQFSKTIKPLFQMKTRIELVDKENVRCIVPWVTKKVICIFSEKTDGYLENAGFMLQQMDLYLQSIGLGTCWLGMGKLDSDAKSNYKDGLDFVIMLAFGHPKGELYRKVEGFRRKPLNKIMDIPDERLEPARLAPSSVNSQPWYFTHSDDSIDVYCIQKGLFKMKSQEIMNVIDIGIAIAHMYISYPDKFEFIVKDEQPYLNGYKYIGSFKI